jgi:hypothetical protein
MPARNQGEQHRFVTVERREQLLKQLQAMWKA